MDITSCFKAYDIRGRVPTELNVDIAFRLGTAYAQHFAPRCVAVGRDVRLSSYSLQNALAHGLSANGVKVLDIGLAGTEEVYFASMQPGVDGGIMITASHNPADYNGMKLVRHDAIAISSDSGLIELQSITERLAITAPDGPAPMSPRDFRADYIRHLCTYIRHHALKPLRVVVNAGNGAAGLIIDALEAHLPFEFIRLHHEPDGTFPHGVPNPLLPEHRQETAEVVLRHGADFGVAWDGDFDRCFLFDERGRFVEGYYLVGLLAAAMLRREPGAKIVHDPRLTWNTMDIVRADGGTPIQSKTGHAFMKERMRAENAIYGGEMSGHHYFREFSYADSGHIPWLLVAALIGSSGKHLSELVGESQQRYPISGEINRRVANISTALDAVERRYAPSALRVERIDGLSLEYPDWRFNLRGSNTEPMLRLNVESRQNEPLVRSKTTELLTLLDALSPTDTLSGTEPRFLKS